MEQNETGVVSNRYVRGINLIKNDTNWYLFNAHGDVVGLANAVGTLTKEYKYDAFGNERDIDSNDTNPWRYCGEYWDNETGTHYLRARVYEPRTGRFLSEDSVRSVSYEYPNGQKLVDPLSLNLYTFCANNPIMFVDPSGESIKSSTMLWALGFMEQINSPLYHNGIVGNIISAERNYKMNVAYESKLIKDSGGHLNGQGLGAFKLMQYGMSPMSGVGCELIALYNALVSMGERMLSLSNIILNFETNGQLYGGMFGTSPQSLERYLSDGFGYTIKSTASDKPSDLNSILAGSKVSIFSFFIGKGLEIHTVAMEVINGNLYVYNRFTGSTQASIYTDFNAFLADLQQRGGSPIYMIGVNSYLYS